MNQSFSRISETALFIIVLAVMVGAMAMPTTVSSQTAQVAVNAQSARAS